MIDLGWPDKQKTAVELQGSAPDTPAPQQAPAAAVTPAGPRMQLRVFATAALGLVLAAGIVAALFNRESTGPDPIATQADALAAQLRDRVPSTGAQPEVAYAPPVAAQPVQTAAESAKAAPPKMRTREEAGMGVMRAVLQGTAIVETDAKALREFRICFRDRLEPGFDYTCVDLRGENPVIEDGVSGQAGFEPHTVFTLSRSEGWPRLYSGNVGARGIVLSARSLSDDYAAQDALRKPPPSAEVAALIEREMKRP
jgi:hypothetical protein